jgi:hypothetical protein
VADHYFSPSTAPLLDDEPMRTLFRPVRDVTDPARPRRGRRGLQVGLALVAAVVIAIAAVTVDALSAPGSDPAAAKLAEWARDHGLGVVVTTAERWRYSAAPPTVGGEPVGGIPVADATAPEPTDTTTPALPALAGGPALPHEGVWQTVSAVGDQPAVEVAYLRPDDKHTAYVVAVLRINPAVVEGRMHPGTRDPGGRWTESTSLTGWTRQHVVAAFNGGFRLTDPSNPGYFSEGRTVAPLRNGQASLVLYDDGHADVGAWNKTVHMTNDVAGVRQNLQPLVADGQVNPSCSSGGQHEWGDTVGQAAYMDRSGFGVTADGHEIYVAGPALSVCGLGQVLADAGVVRGMELDINPTWVDGVYFTPDPAGGDPIGHKLYPSQRASADHYMRPSSRDWFSWSLRR